MYYCLRNHFMVALLVWVFTVTSQIKKPTLYSPPSTLDKNKNVSTFCKHFQVHSTEKQKHSSLIPLHQSHRFLNHITLKKSHQYLKTVPVKRVSKHVKINYVWVHKYNQTCFGLIRGMRKHASLSPNVCTLLLGAAVFIFRAIVLCPLLNAEWIRGNHCGNRTNRDDTEH